MFQTGQLCTMRHDFCVDLTHEHMIFSCYFKGFQFTIDRTISFHYLMFVFKVDGHGSFIAVFGGEIDPCYKGNESGGGFSNELILINDATLEMTTTNPLNDEIGLQLKRGWSSGTSLSNDRKNQLIVFGGLTGTNDNPKRLNDLWIGTISV